MLVKLIRSLPFSILLLTSAGKLTAGVVEVPANGTAQTYVEDAKVSFAPAIREGNFWVYSAQGLFEWKTHHSAVSNDFSKMFYHNEANQFWQTARGGMVSRTLDFSIPGFADNMQYRINYRTPISAKQKSTPTGLTVIESALRCKENGTTFQGKDAERYPFPPFFTPSEWKTVEASAVIQVTKSQCPSGIFQLTTKFSTGSAVDKTVWVNFLPAEVTILELGQPL